MRSLRTVFLILLLITASIFIMSLFSCANMDTGNKAGANAEDETSESRSAEISVIDSPEIIGYDSYIVTSTAPYEQPPLPEAYYMFRDDTSKQYGQTKKITVSGKVIDLKCDSTVRSPTRGYVLNNYSGKSEDGYVRASFDSETGRMISYQFSQKYVSDREEKISDGHTNVFLTEQELIDYAESVLKEYTGVSVNGCDVQILSTVYTDNGIQNSDEFVPNGDKDVGYRIDFKKSISNIELLNCAYVRVEPETGVFTEFEMSFDFERYKPYENVQIDREKLDSALLKYYGRVAYDPVPDLKLFVYNDELWVRAVYMNRIPYGDHYHNYAFYCFSKLAEIVK